MSQNQLRKLAEQIYSQLEQKQFPKVEIPDRSSRNIKLENSVLVLGDRKIVRSAGKLGTARSFAQLCWLNYFVLKHLVSQHKTTTLRDIYYTSLRFRNVSFKEQSESNKIVEDLEALTGVSREQFNIFPKSRAVIFGDLKFKYIEPRKWITNVGREYALNEHPDGLSIGPELTTNTEFFDCKVDKIIVAEKQAVFQRFVEDGVYERFKALLVFTEGQPPRNCRILIRKLSQQFNLPVYILCDGDPWGLQIFLTIRYGSINLAHIKHLTVPTAKWMGVTPQDIIDYKLPAEKLTDNDYKKVYNLMKDVRCKADKFILEQLRLWRKIKKKVELEAFSRHGLSFICDVYLKDKLKE